MRTRIIYACAIVASALLGCESTSEIRGGTATIVRSSSTTSPIQARQVTTRETIDPATGAVVGREVTTRDEGGGQTSSSQINANATGASGRASGKDVSQSITGTPPELNLPEAGGARGGGVRGAAEVLAGGDSWPLYVIGGLLIVAGLGGLYLRQVRLGATAIAGGIGLVLMTVYPIVFWIILGLGVAGVCLWAWDARAREQIEGALGRVARGVSAADPRASSAVKSSINKTTTVQDDLIIAAAKRREGI